jgi:hypothetical protein
MWYGYCHEYRRVISVRHARRPLLMVKLPLTQPPCTSGTECNPKESIQHSQSEGPSLQLKEFFSPACDLLMV